MGGKKTQLAASSLQHPLNLCLWSCNDSYLEPFVLAVLTFSSFSCIIPTSLCPTSSLRWALIWKWRYSSVKGIHCPWELCCWEKEGGTHLVESLASLFVSLIFLFVFQPLCSVLGKLSPWILPVWVTAVQLKEGATKNNIFSKILFFFLHGTRFLSRCGCAWGCWWDTNELYCLSCHLFFMLSRRMWVLSCSLWLSPQL